MKNLKRTLAVFVSAIMVMAMLVGCGGYSVGSRLRDVTDAGESVSANKVASTLAKDETVGSDTVKAAVESVASSDSYTVTTYTETHSTTSVIKARIADEKNNTVGVYYAFEVTSTLDDEVVVAAKSVFDSIQADLAKRYEGIEYYIAASLMDEEAGEYVVVVYADFAEATSVSAAA